MSKVIIYSTETGRVEIIVPAPQSLAWGRRVLTAHKMLVFPGGSGPEFDDLPEMIGVAEKLWAIIVMQLVAKNLGIEFTLDLVTLEPEDTYLTRLQGHVLPPNAVNVQRIEADEVPTNRAFRNAWSQETSGALITDMDKSREIHMNKIRDARVGRLAELDIEWGKLKGQKKDPEADAIEAERQVLRDLPTTFDLSVYATPEELFDAWPAVLERPVQPPIRENNVIPIIGLR